METHSKSNSINIFNTSDKTVKTMNYPLNKLKIIPKIPSPLLLEGEIMPTWSKKLSRKDGGGVLTNKSTRRTLTSFGLNWKKKITIFLKKSVQFQLYLSRFHSNPKAQRIGTALVKSIWRWVRNCLNSVKYRSTIIFKTTSIWGTKKPCTIIWKPSMRDKTKMYSTTYQSLFMSKDMETKLG